MAQLRFADTITEKQLRRRSSFQVIRSFIRHYSLARIASFFIIANLSLYVTNVYKNFHRERSRSVTYDGFDHAFAVALQKVERDMVRDYTIARLEHDINNSAAVRVSRTAEIRDITVDLGSDLSKAMPKRVLQEVKIALSAMKCPNNGKIKVYYRPGQRSSVKFVALLDKSGKYKKQIVRYNEGFYNSDGVRLDVSYKLPGLLSLVTSSGAKPRISSGYGRRIHPVLKRISFHTGVDVAAPMNSKIHAALPGKVKKIGYHETYGNYIILKHQDNIDTLYAHLSSIDSKMVIGKKVQQGDVIAKVGKTGRATGPHVHFETRVNKKHVNPRSIKPMHPKLNATETDKVRALMKQYRPS